MEPSKEEGHWVECRALEEPVENQIDTQLLYPRSLGHQLCPSVLRCLHVLLSPKAVEPRDCEGLS